MITNKDKHIKIQDQHIANQEEIIAIQQKENLDLSKIVKTLTLIKEDYEKQYPDLKT